MVLFVSVYSSFAFVKVADFAPCMLNSIGMSRVSFVHAFLSQSVSHTLHSLQCHCVLLPTESIWELTDTE